MVSTSYPRIGALAIKKADICDDMSLCLYVHIYIYIIFRCAKPSGSIIYIYICMYVCMYVCIQVASRISIEQLPKPINLWLHKDGLCRCCNLCETR